MRWQAGSDPHLGTARTRTRTRTLGNAARLYAGLLLFALTCLGGSLLMLPGVLVTRRAARRRFARALVSYCFRAYLTAMERMGSLQLDLSALDTLRDAPPMVIAPNHPSMIDAALVLSRLPNLTCIMKAQVLDNPLFGVGARMASYVVNDPPRSMVRGAVDGLRAGGHLLLFPEGTRTTRLRVNPLQRMVGVVARRAGVPIQTVLIETDTAFLGKGWPLSRIPRMPMEYRLRLGQRFEPSSDADALCAQLEAYFHSELARGPLPQAPAHTGPN